MENENSKSSSSNTFLKVIAIIAVLLVAYFAFRSFSSSSDKSNTEGQNEQIVDGQNAQDDLLQNLLTPVTLTVPETGVVVTISGSDGDEIAKYQDGEEEGLVAITGYSESINDGEFVALIAINRGGSSEEIYLAGFQPGKSSNQMTDSEFLGDRVAIKSLTVSGDKVTITFMEHGVDQAMAEEPNVTVIKTFVYSDGKLTEE